MAARVFRFGVATWSSNTFWIQIKVACLQHYIAEEQSRAHPFKPILSRPFLRLVWFYSSLVLFESHSLSSYLTGRKQENRGNTSGDRQKIRTSPVAGGEPLPPAQRATCNSAATRPRLSCHGAGEKGAAHPAQSAD